MQHHQHRHCVSIQLLTAITHTTTGATGIGAATGLPAGVTAAWAANTITISGTPTAAGVFNYSIPLTGGCGTVNATGTITVTPANTVGAASSTPTLCINTALTAITHTTTGATGIGAATGLPAGVTAAWAANMITISGTPTAAEHLITAYRLQEAAEQSMQQERSRSLRLIQSVQHHQHRHCVSIQH